MKLIHLSDLHLGKRVNEFSMIEDQQYILTEIIEICDEEQPDGVVIAGDIYDKSVPPAEAVQLFDDFLTALAKRRLQVFIISGNHDSAERVAFGGRLMHQSGIHISPAYNGEIYPISLNDEWGTVNFYMIPFVKPAHVRRFYEEEVIESYTDALKTIIDDINIIDNQRNVLITHQFVTGADRCESEDISIGGSDNVDAGIFSGFDYVALGHLHGPQNMTGERIRYCGTPLKYSFSEVNHKKSVTVVSIKEKGNLSVRTIPLIPKRDLREIRGTYMELTSRANYEGTDTQDYMHITLTDEEDIPGAVGKLRVIYPNLMKLDYDNKRTRGSAEVSYSDEHKGKTPLQLFGDFYEQRNNQPMSKEQENFLQKLIEEIWEDEQ